MSKFDSNGCDPSFLFPFFFLYEHKYKYKLILDR